MNKPTPELVEQTLARLGKPGAAAYFFDRLNNPLWIEPLAARGFFKRPPAAEHNAEQGTVAFPDWPELRYLQRMVDIDPQAVGPIAVNVPETDNARIRNTLALIGSRLPLPWARHLGSRAEAWLDQALLRAHFGESFAKLIAHLASLGELKLAFRIAKRLLFVDEDSSSRESQRVPDGWHLERYLQHCLPTLMQIDGARALDFMIYRLLTATKRDSSSPLEDYSYIWRRDIVSANFSGKEVQDVLVDAVRNAALELAHRPIPGAEAVCRRLLQAGRPLLTRIALFVALHAAGPNDPVVAELLCDINLVDRRTCRAEYGPLLETLFPKLAGPLQERIVQILTGTNLLQAIPETARTGLDDARRTRYSKSFERDRLLAFGNALPPTLRRRLDQLLAEVGSPQDEVSRITSVIAASPLTAEQIEAMSVDDLLQYVRTWSPGAEFGESTPESLGQQLHIAARSRVEEFSAQADKWIGQDPTYVRWILMGLTDAISNNGHIADWGPPLTLMQWVVQQPDPLDAPSADGWSGRDIGWAWVRQSIARLLERALAGSEPELVAMHRDSVWQVLESLLRDPDPTPRESTRDDDEHGALSVAVNSVRGSALEAVFRFLWHIHPNNPEAGPLTFAPTPQVRAALETSLTDASPAIRAVLGQWLLTLFHFDFRWTADRIDEIFPQHPDLRSFWRGGWRTFVDFGGPYDPAFEVLYPKYVFAVDQLDPNAEDVNKRLGERGLGQHLASYHWRGLGGPRSRDLLLGFFDRCSETGAGEIVASLGRGLQAERAIPVETLERLARLWESLSATHPTWSERKSREVRRRFGEWFCSPHLDEGWSLHELEACLRSGAGLVESEGIIKRLTHLAAQHPAAVARCTTLLVQDDKQALLPTLWQRELTMLLKTLAESPDQEARTSVQVTVNRLIESGNLFARDILRSSP